MTSANAATAWGKYVVTVPLITFSKAIVTKTTRAVGRLPSHIYVRRTRKRIILVVMKLKARLIAFRKLAVRIRDISFLLRGKKVPIRRELGSSKGNLNLI